MLSQEQYIRITRAIPALQCADPQLTRDFQTESFYVNIPGGKNVFVEGDQPNAIALLTAGVVRVYKIGETGREITLYRFGHGESCLLTANAILSRKSFPAIATVEREVQAVMVPANAFRDWVKRYDLWREFFFDLLSNRLLTVLALVDAVVFQRMDRRIAAFLVTKYKLQHPIHITHQEIAAELGSSREVISRLLGDFSNQGLIKLKRGSIEILDLEALEARSLM